MESIDMENKKKNIAHFTRCPECGSMKIRMASVYENFWEPPTLLCLHCTTSFKNPHYRKNK